MAILEVTNLKFSYGDKELYAGAELMLNPGEHAAIYGINGSGKSTLLNIIVGELRPDKGSVNWTPHVTYSYLDQHRHQSEEQTLEEYLYGVYAPLYEKEKEMEELYVKAAEGVDGYEKLLEKASRIGDELMEKDFYALSAKVGAVMDGLGFEKATLNKQLKILSPGMREKAYLAKMMLEEKDVLIMDEPTNFLDQTQVAYLIQFLQSYDKAFLVVSHDEGFLKEIVDVVFYLRNGKITRYKGDFDHFLVQRDLDLTQQEKNYYAQQRYIKKEEAFIAAHIVRATSARAAKSRRARLAHLERLEDPGKEGGEVRFSFPYSRPTGRYAIEIENLLIGYDAPLLAPINLQIESGDKVALLGHNGVGKTTFIKTILSLIPSLGGRYKFHPSADVLYFEQDSNISAKVSPFQYLRDYYPDYPDSKIRSILGSVGVRSTTAMRPFEELSGGEMAKTKLAPITQEKSNILILDEPTNHLDSKAKKVLYEAIEEYPGTVILVCHEKDFSSDLVDYEITFS